VSAPSIARNLGAVRRRVAAAAERAGRSPSDVVVVAVSKTFPAALLREAIEAGVDALGENRAQELREKALVVGERARWHFVGRLQTNKVRHVVGVAELIHSVDRLGLAEAISRRACSLRITQDVLLEVNVAGDPDKGGARPADAAALAAAVAGLEGVRLRGLMTMPPWPEDPEDSRPLYRALAELGAAVGEAVPGASELSMGMTRDFEVAVEEGATLVRIGEAIFGLRRAR
jgi:pyridoxal phosphate enzyme (YggS family)